jgi:hypothetical protein
MAKGRGKWRAAPEASNGKSPRGRFPRGPRIAPFPEAAAVRAGRWISSGHRGNVHEEFAAMKLSRFLGGLIAVLAPVLILILIVKNGVNVPFGDEWAIPGQFLILDKHTFADCFAQNNESRSLIPKVIFLAVSKVAGWQPKHFMVLGWLMVLGIFALIYQVCYRRVARGRDQDMTGLLCLALSSALLFSPAAFENWLWGLQWVIFLPLLCALVAFHIQDRTQSFALRLGATVFLNAVATFSFANGMLLWVISFPFWREALGWLAGRRPKAGRSRLLLWSVLYVLAAAICVRVYFTDYQKMSAHPSLVQALGHPWQLLKYFAAWCGAPFHSGVVLRVILGILFISAVLFVFLRIAVRVRSHPGWRSVSYLRMQYPALLIITYAFASGLTTAVGRAGFGVEQAFSSRYLFHSGALLVGLIAAFNSQRILTPRLRQPAGNYQRVLRGVIAAFLILFVRTWHHYLPWFEDMRIGRVQNLLTVRMLALAPKSALVDRACAWTDLSVLVRTLNDRHIHETASFGDWILEELKHPGKENGGFARLSNRSPSETGIIGCAVKPLQNVPADSVLVCRRGQAGGLEPWMMLATGFKNKDVPPGKPFPAKSGFMESFPWDPTAGVPAMELFSVDESNRRLYPILQIP